MKNFIENFKKFIRFFVAIFASREFAFIYCLIGTMGQVTHTYYLTESISSFHGGFKVFQAVLISFFISSSLLYFVAIADKNNKSEYKKINLAINIFMVIEILINFYYYSRHLIIDSQEMQIFDFIFATLVSCLLPVTIKLYANSIKAKDWIDEMANPHKLTVEEETDLIAFSKEQNKSMMELIDKVNNLNQSVLNGPKFDEESMKKTVELVNKLFDSRKDEIEVLIKSNEKDDIELPDIETYVNSIRKELDTDVANIFEKNKKLFLTQFENKCKVLAEQFKPGN